MLTMLIVQNLKASVTEEPNSADHIVEVSGTSIHAVMYSYCTCSAAAVSLLLVTKREHFWNATSCVLMFVAAQWWLVNRCQPREFILRYVFFFLFGDACTSTSTMMCKDRGKERERSGGVVVAQEVANNSCQMCRVPGACAHSHRQRNACEEPQQEVRSGPLTPPLKAQQERRERERGVVGGSFNGAAPPVKKYPIINLLTVRSESIKDTQTHTQPASTSEWKWKVKSFLLRCKQNKKKRRETDRSIRPQSCNV